MNDAFVGDIGDYGKYGLLRVLTRKTHFQLGVVWMRTATIKEFEYLERDELVNCDPELYQALQPLVYSGAQTIAGLEASDALPTDTIYFNKLLDFRGTPANGKKAIRREWFKEAMDRLETAKLVFIDPDNGLESPLKKRRTVEGPRNVRYDELKPFHHRGQSLIVYQHADRGKGGIEETIRRRASDLLRELKCKSIWALRWHRVQSRVYFLIPTLDHHETIEKAIDSFRKTEWCTGDHFTVQEIR